MREPKVTKPLDSNLRAWLFAEVSTDGECNTLHRLQLSKSSLLRALSGLPVYGSTRGIIEAAWRDSTREGVIR